MILPFTSLFLPGARSIYVVALVSGSSSPVVSIPREEGDLICCCAAFGYIWAISSNFSVNISFCSLEERIWRSKIEKSGMAERSIAFTAVKISASVSTVGVLKYSSSARSRIGCLIFGIKIYMPYNRSL